MKFSGLSLQEEPVAVLLESKPGKIKAKKGEASMFWWTGRGIWILGIASLFVLPAEHRGPDYMSFGFGMAAATVFLLRNWFDESSLFSIPARFWPVVLLAFAVVMHFKI